MKWFALSALFLSLAAGPALGAEAQAPPAAATPAQK